jgi:alkanesulfonate monooxygenase SsuD/methylene tetrahydromethanopterin reductase-like flavin-dependent oxidoreductase (luciferase family)
VQYGLSVPNFGEFFSPRRLAELAREAEDAGWDGFFLWDHVLAWPMPMVDPWVALTAIAMSTQRMRIGPIVTPLPRRRPVKLAREAVSLDHLSEGRLILGVGIGQGTWEWDNLGEEIDLHVRGEMLDEALDLITSLWTGEPVRFEGKHYCFRGGGDAWQPEIGPAMFLPPPVQRPRIPIWVGGTWPHKPPFRRAARWDGMVPMCEGQGLGEGISPEALREAVAFVHERRRVSGLFDVVASGHTRGDDPDADNQRVVPIAEAGATWWLEDLSPWAFGWHGDGTWPLDAMQLRVRRGPPRCTGRRVESP